MQGIAHISINESKHIRGALTIVYMNFIANAIEAKIYNSEINTEVLTTNKTAKTDQNRIIFICGLNNESKIIVLLFDILITNRPHNSTETWTKTIKLKIVTVLRVLEKPFSDDFLLSL